MSPNTSNLVSRVFTFRERLSTLVSNVEILDSLALTNQLKSPKAPDRKIVIISTAPFLLCPFYYGLTSFQPRVAPKCCQIQSFPSSGKSASCQLELEEAAILASIKNL